MVKFVTSYELSMPSSDEYFWVMHMTTRDEPSDKVKVFAEHRYREFSNNVKKNLPVNPDQLLAALKEYTTNSRWRDGKVDNKMLAVLESAIWGPLYRWSYEPKYWHVGEPIWHPVSLRLGASALHIEFENEYDREDTYDFVMPMDDDVTSYRGIVFTLLVPDKSGDVEVVVDLPQFKACADWLVLEIYRNQQRVREMQVRRDGRVQVTEFGEL